MLQSQCFDVFLWFNFGFDLAHLIEILRPRLSSAEKHTEFPKLDVLMD